MTDTQLLLKTLEATEHELFRLFLNLDRPGTILHPKFLFLPGTRPPHSRILFVAHVDTVRPKYKNFHFRPEVSGGFIRGNNSILGADDRAGVAALWAMAMMGDDHSILLTDEEESGGVGAKNAVNAISELLSKHRFAIEPDRWGDGDAVFYRGTEFDGFKDFLKPYLPKAHFNQGSYTDIATICPQVEIPGVNISIGYMFQHSTKEILSVDAWRRSVDVMQVIAKRTQYPKFAKPTKKDLAYDDWDSWWSVVNEREQATARPYESIHNTPPKARYSKPVNQVPAKVANKKVNRKTSKKKNLPKTKPVNTPSPVKQEPTLATVVAASGVTLKLDTHDGLTPKQYLKLYNLKPYDMIPLVGRHGNVVSHYRASNLTSHEWEFYDPHHACIPYHDILNAALDNSEPLPRIHENGVITLPRK